jgi:excisionase family DNA binding protein
VADDPLLTSQEVADYLGIPLATVYTWAARGIGPDRIKVGRFSRYRKSKVDAWLEARTVQAQVPA